MIYLLPAFIWWALLLWNKNKEVFALQHEMARLTAHHFTKAEVDVHHAKIDAEFNRQKRMIIGEGSFFFLLLVLGVYYIRANFKKEIQLAQQQRNFQLSITHELKSPIAAVQLAMETLLKRDLPKETRDKIHGNALRDTKRLNRLVEDILLSATLDDVWKPHREAVDIQFCIESVAGNLERIYPDAQITIDIDENVEYFSLDEKALTSVLSNLIENALKYSDTEAQFCAISAQKTTKEGLEIIVSDQGFGISDVEKKRIFEKFYRIGSEDTRSAKGTGLGLYIVHKIMKAHKGTVKVVDNKPKGTSFILNFGLHEAG